MPTPAPAPRRRDTMSMATRTNTQWPALRVADSHDLIRLHGARENNLKDVSVEIPKRRLTVFTGISGSGKSSLVFGTIAAESQRLINETYSAVVQGFMPTGSSTSAPVPATTAAGSSSRANPPTSSPPAPPSPASTSRPTSAPDRGPRGHRETSSLICCDTSRPVKGLVQQGRVGIHPALHTVVCAFAVRNCCGERRRSA